VNALCWQRTLDGDFAEIVALLSELAGSEATGVTVLEPQLLEQLRPSAAGALALRTLEEDLQRLWQRGVEPELNLVVEYSRDDAASVLPTDVYSFHADRAPVEVDTWLCTYYGAPTEGLRNDEAQLRVDIPATRAALRELFGEPEGAAFEAFLRDHSYDLHFAPNTAATPWPFTVGCLWRVAVSWPGALVPPCIHRAPSTSSGTRLLLIG
jgi:hypothetical protein